MVSVLLGSGFEEAEALVPVDLLRRAGVEVVLTALTEELEVSGGHGITVKADTTLSRLDRSELEMVILPGGLGGVAAISHCPEALELIRSLSARGKYVAAICAAPTLLASLGLLEQRKAVCYPGMEDEMAGAEVQIGSPVVTDEYFITAEAAGSSFVFGLKLVELLKGAEVAEQVKNSVHYHG